MMTSMVCHDTDPLQMLFQSSAAAMIIPSSCSQEATTFDWSDFPVISETYNSLAVSLFDQQRYLSTEALYSNIQQQQELQQSTCSSSTSSTTATRRQRCQPTDSQHPSSSYSTCSTAVTHKDNSRSIIRKRVKFSDVLTIRSHDLTLGDHPCCAGGLALDLDWTYQDHVASFARTEQASRKRRPSQLRVPYSERCRRLLEATGCSGSELLLREYYMTTESTIPPDAMDDIDAYVAMV
jgi:hypothetical protein